MNFEDFKKLLLGFNSTSEKLICDLDGDLSVKFVELESRRDFLKSQMEKALSKLESDFSRFLADVKDRYNLHGKRLNIKDQKVYEIIEEK